LRRPTNFALQRSKKPSTESLKPSREQIKPSTKQIKPLIESIKPSAELRKPSLDQMKPSMEQRKPSKKQKRPSTEQMESSAEQKSARVDNLHYNAFTRIRPPELRNTRFGPPLPMRPRNGIIVLFGLHGDREIEPDTAAGAGVELEVDVVGDAPPEVGEAGGDGAAEGGGIGASMEPSTRMPPPALRARSRRRRHEINSTRLPAG
jgi:hypothetical protein